MATVTEDASVELSLSAAQSASEYSTRDCERYYLSAVAVYGKDFDASEMFYLSSSSANADSTKSFDVVSSFSVSAVAVNNIVTSQNVTSGFYASSSDGSRYRDGAATETVNLSAAVDALNEKLSSAQFSMSAAAAVYPYRTHQAGEGIAVGDSVVTIVEHDEEESIEIGETKSVSIDSNVTETVGLGASSGLAQRTDFLASAGIKLAAAASWSVTATTTLISRLALRDAALPVDAEHPVVWANSKRMASAVWKQMPYESFAMHQGALLAAGPDGVYLMSGTSDGGAAIRASIKGDLTDLGSDKRKVFDAATANGKVSAPVRFGVETEMGEFQYQTHLPSSQYPMTHRAAIGRGLTGRSVRFSFNNNAPGSEGAYFSLRDIQVGVGDSGRVR